MLFTSYAFIAFIAVAFFLYYRIPRKWQWPFLLIISIGFYASAGIFYPIFLLVSSAVTYLAGLWIERDRKQEKDYIRENGGRFASRQEKKEFKQKGEKRRRKLMVSAFLILLAVLGVFKYADFVIDNINAVFYAVGSDRELEYLDLLLPMGISFYTFQSLGYLLDVYWEKIDAQKNFFKHLLFVSFFPQLVQGPISRYSNLSQTLYEEHVFDKKQVIFGLERILWGYFKKLVVADTILTATTAVIGDEYYNGAWVLVGIIFYGIELYADFTGGIDITIGIAQVFGVKVAENFIRPYFSKNIAEYWRRWHISLTTWFRDYVYIPLGGNRKGMPRMYVNMFIIWTLTGIWHGAEWNFILWGMYYFVFQAIEKLFLGKWLAKIPRVFQHIYTMFVVTLGWVLFRCDSGLSQCVTWFKALFSGNVTSEGMSLLHMYAVQYGVYLVLGVILSMPIYRVLKAAVYKRIQKNRICKWACAAAGYAVLLALFYVSVLYLVNSTYNPFIYFRF